MTILTSDVLTSKDFPVLREFIATHVDELDYFYSDEFIEASRRAISELDRAIRTDRDPKGRLKKALDHWVLIGRRELRLHNDAALS